MTPPLQPNKFKCQTPLINHANSHSSPADKKISMATMREMDPQSVAARHRRERTSERIRILQRLVPGGTKMDTASMLDEAVHYVKFLKRQVQSLEQDVVSVNNPMGATIDNITYSSLVKAHHHQAVIR
ncbi:hypothetical protein V6N11_058511 [Hibiscus sabdariffa]|uniref:BHLH domain-containing protein n=1 Tax=Hibiscus sabdariffa TaxID=183260 RepID=A0ABR2U584_9ROSI